MSDEQLNEVVESVDASEEVVESPEASSAAPDAAVVEDLQAKKDEGVKLSKKEEKQLREYNLKVNGKERKLSVDVGNEDEMKKYLQKALASDDAFKHSSEVRKAAVQFIEELRTNPRKVLSDPNINVDLKKLAQDIMNEQMQEMEKTPEQREKEALLQEVERLRKEREDEKKTWEEKELARLQAESEKQIEGDISAALDIGGIPKTPRTVKAMAEMLMLALQNNIDLSAKDIAPIIKNNNLREFKEIINGLSDDQLEEYMGKEVLGRLNKKRVAKAKAVPETASQVKSTGETSKKEEKKSDNKQDYRSFFGV
jgi:hypothetical protein